MNPTKNRNPKPIFLCPINLVFNSRPIDKILFPFESVWLLPSSFIAGFLSHNLISLSGYKLPVYYFQEIISILLYNFYTLQKFLVQLSFVQNYYYYNQKHIYFHSIFHKLKILHFLQKEIDLKANPSSFISELYSVLISPLSISHIFIVPFSSAAIISLLLFPIATELT